MKKAILAAATALSMAAVPAMAQDSDRDGVGFMSAEHQELIDELEPDARVYFDTWSADQQQMYFGWNDALRGYYWSLERDEQEAWWYLTDEQRITLFQIQGEAEREAAWDSVVQQVAVIEAENTSANTSTTASTDINFVSNAVVQDAPSFDGEYPVCKSDMDDHCINAWAAGMRGPDVDRPLTYWPGESVTDSRSGG